MTYAVELSAAAERQFKGLDRQARASVQGTLDLLATNPRPPKATMLVGGTGEWRARVGDYRVIYEIHDRQLLVLVVTIGNRRDVYRRR